MAFVKEAEKMKMNIVGGRALGQASIVETDINEAHKTNTEFWSTIGNEFLGEAALPSWGNYFPSEDKLHLLGELANKRVLEIGCGKGGSLKYAAEHGASDLWGLDISENQIERAKDFLGTQGISAKFVCSPMEAECELPTGYFDLVYSVYGIGWSMDLNRTFQRIHSYLKKDGVFVWHCVVCCF